MVRLWRQAMVVMAVLWFGAVGQGCVFDGAGLDGRRCIADADCGDTARVCAGGFCQAATCGTDTECVASGRGDRCEAGQCVRGGVLTCQTEADCGGAACVDGVCQGTAELCGEGPACGSGEVCEEGRCVAEGASVCRSDVDCDDTLFCNGAEHCAPSVPGANARGCVGGRPPVLDDGLDCTDDVCDEALDRVGHQPTEACACDVDADCADQLPGDCMTVACQENICRAVARAVGESCDSPVACLTNAVCDAAGACLTQRDDGVCDDGEACNGLDRCNPDLEGSNGRGCVVEMPAISDGIACTVDTCVECAPDDAVCLVAGYRVEHDDTACACVTAADCGDFADPDACEVGVCGANRTCSAMPAAEGTGCDDGFDCTRQDACDAAGQCVGAPDDGRCDDGLLCSGEERCDAALGCVAGTSVAEGAEDGVACTVARCFEGGSAAVVGQSDAACGGRVTDGLVAYYPFVDGAGTVVRDYSGVEPLQHLALSGRDTTWQDSSLSFVDGKAKVVDPPKLFARLTSSAALTVEVWMLPGTVAATGMGADAIVTYSKDDHNRNFTFAQDKKDVWWSMRTDDNGMTSGDNNGKPDLIWGNALATAQGNATLGHYVVTWSQTRGEARLFVNGALVSGQARTGGLSNWHEDYDFGVADEVDNTDRQWPGTLYLVAIYDRALTAAEVQQNFGAGVSPAQ